MLLQNSRARDLFREMKRDPHLRSLLLGQSEVTIYSLEE